MRNIVLGLLLAAATLATKAQSADLLAGTSFYDGVCSVDSFVAEGPAGSNLSSYRRPVVCDSAVVSRLRGNRTLVQFSEKRALHSSPLAFGGSGSPEGVVDMQRVYLEPGKPTVMDDAACKFDLRARLRMISCFGHVREDDRQTVTMVEFRLK